MEGFAPYPETKEKPKAWIDQRLGRFTASEIWKLFTEPRSKEAKANGELSETTKSYILEKVAEELTGQCKQVTAASLEWGIDHEEEAIKYFVNLTGCEVVSSQFIPFSTMSGGTPDGLVDNDGVLEIKCPYDSVIQTEYLLLKDQNDLKADFPQYYYQVQANLLFSKRGKGFFATYDPRMQDDNHKMKILLVTPNIEDQTKIVEKLHQAQKYKEKILMQFKP